jgi:hypothetical protein
VVASTADQPCTVECPEQLTSRDAPLNAREPEPPRFRGDGTERPPAQVDLGLKVIIRAERTDLDAAQKVTRTSPLPTGVAVPRTEVSQ